jgi:hypothetical protein
MGLVGKKTNETYTLIQTGFNFKESQCYKNEYADIILAFFGFCS